MILRPVLQPVLRPAGRRLDAAASGSDALTALLMGIFGAGGKGLWFDQADRLTGFTDSAGTTQHTASGQSTGLRLDKARGLARTTIFSDNTGSTSGWTGSSATVSTVGGMLQVATSGGFGNASRSFTTVVGQRYFVSLRFNGSGVANCYYRCGTTANGFDNFDSSIPAAGGTGAQSFVATATATYFTVGSGTGGTETIAFDDFLITTIPGIHIAQTSGSARPEWDVIGAASSDFHDTVDDGNTTGASALPVATLDANSDVYVLLNRSSGGNMVVCSQAPSDGGKYFGVLASGTVGSGTAASQIGAAWTSFVNNVQVGGTATTSADALNTAVGSGAYKLLEYRNADLSAWTAFTVGLYSTFMLGGDVAQIVITPAQSAGVRSSLRTLIGAKAGLSL